MSQTELQANGSRSTALAIQQSPPEHRADIMASAAAFEHLQRVAKMYASSYLIPEHMRNKVADVTIALAMAHQLNENPLIIMQSIYVVSGKAGWSATYMIARANRSGAFKGSIRWREVGTGNDLRVTAFATLAETGDEVNVEVSMKMAIAEQWTRNKKYESMPVQMLRYRSATMLIRLYCPEAMLGKSSDEIDDMRYTNGGDEDVVTPTGNLADIIDGEVSTPTAPINQNALPNQSESPEPDTDPEESPPEKEDSMKPEPPTPPPAPSPFTDYAGFVAAMELVARDRSVDPGVFDACIKKLPVFIDVKTAKRSGQEVREKIWNAARVGQFDWATAKVVE